MQEKERLASEEAEKRLKAALTAKREPNNASRVASPSIGDVPATGEGSQEAKTSGTEPNNGDMNVDISAENSSATIAQPEVCTTSLRLLSSLQLHFRALGCQNCMRCLTTLRKSRLHWLRNGFGKTLEPQPTVVSDETTHSPGFYLTFWQLSTYELAPPAARYDEECSTLRNLSRQEDSKYISAERSSDRTKRQTSYLHKDRRNRYNQYIHMLGQELKEQTAVRVFTIKRLAREKQHWFTHCELPPCRRVHLHSTVPGVGVSAMPMAQVLVDYCFLPRCLLSPMDADFCAQFIKVVHNLSTPGFPTISCWDRVSSLSTQT